MQPRTSARLRLRLLLAVAILAIAGAVWIVAQTQRDAADRSFQKVAAGQRMLTAMLDQQTGLRGFALTHREQFLDPLRRGRVDFDAAVADARAASDAEEELRSIARQSNVASRWQMLARTEIDRLRRDPSYEARPRFALLRKRVFDRFRTINAGFQGKLSEERDQGLAQAGLVSVAVTLALGLLFAVAGSLLIQRHEAREREGRARERRYRETQAEFTETMQAMRGEAEAHALVKRHLERAIPDSSVVVLNRNNSDSRLTATTQVPDGSPLAETLVDAAPEACLAIRLAREYEQRPDAQPLLACELCGMSSAEVTCVPSLVSGEVIGSVLVEHPRALAPEERDRIDDSVAQAAPVLANLRTLAIAETRAATDALTGLSNQRSCQETLKRMTAHASRSVSPLSAILLDLDHFKQINDVFGHGAGDDVLAAVGEVLSSTLRASDFAGRYGGEEFLVLLPDTDRDGAAEAAEKLRQSIERIDVPDVSRSISASFGVAAFPTDALDGETLVRMADRALYAAKRGGRNRVEAALRASAE